jgi:hypothetical protein
MIDTSSMYYGNVQRCSVFFDLIEFIIVNDARAMIKSNNRDLLIYVFLSCLSHPFSFCFSFSQHHKIAYDLVSILFSYFYRSAKFIVESLNVVSLSLSHLLSIKYAFVLSFEICSDSLVRSTSSRSLVIFI